MEHPVFGTMEHDGFFWSGTVTLNLQDQEETVSLIVHTDGEEEPSQRQCDAFSALMARWDQLWPVFLERILEEYQKQRSQLGYDREEDEFYPPIDTAAELLAHIQLTGISIPYEDMYDGRGAGVIFDCTWDSENGVGLCLCDEQVVDIGGQDITM